jgi:predicted transcriptional regulator
MRTVSFKLPPVLDDALSELARRRHASRSALVREAIEAMTHETRRSVTDVAGDLVGCLEGPADLSTDPRFMEGFGE